MKKITLILSVFFLAISAQVYAQDAVLTENNVHYVDVQDDKKKIRKTKKIRKKRAKRRAIQRQRALTSELRAMKKVARADGKVTRAERKLIKRKERQLRKKAIRRNVARSPRTTERYRR